MPASDYIWRFERDDGTGIYRGQDDAIPAPFGGDYTINGLHNTPWWDGIAYDDFTDDHRFGFASLSQARRWFYEPRDADHFAEAGMKLTAWPKDEIEGLVCGRSQVTFIPGTAVSIRLDVHRLWDTPARELGKTVDTLRSTNRNPTPH